MAVLNRLILIGDVRLKLAKLPKESIDLAMFSPPYWAVRDYHFATQIGLEATFKEYLDNMLKVMALLKPLIKKTGSIVVNLGDTYGGGFAHSDWHPGPNYDGKIGYSEERSKEMRFISKIKKPHPKSLLMIPSRFAIRCIDELNLTLRNFIPWEKSNAMPYSGTDRLQNKWEPIFWFTVSPKKYYCDLDSIRVKAEWDNAKPSKIPVHKRPGQTFLIEPVSEEVKLTKQDKLPRVDQRGFNKRCLTSHYEKIRERQQAARESGKPHDAALNNPKGKNPGDVLHLQTKPYLGDHQAAYTVNLPLYFISFLCPPGGIVLDPFAGSGTTAEAAEMLGRKWVLIEGSKKYLKQINQRLKPYMNQKII